MVHANRKRYNHFGMSYGSAVNLLEYFAAFPADQLYRMVMLTSENLRYKGLRATAISVLLQLHGLTKTAVTLFHHASTHHHVIHFVVQYGGKQNMAQRDSHMRYVSIKLQRNHVTLVQ